MTINFTTAIDFSIRREDAVVKECMGHVNRNLVLFNILNLNLRIKVGVILGHIL